MALLPSLAAPPSLPDRGTIVDGEQTDEVRVKMHQASSGRPRLLAVGSLVACGLATGARRSASARSTNRDRADQRGTGEEKVEHIMLWGEAGGRGGVVEEGEADAEDVGGATCAEPTAEAELLPGAPAARAPSAPSGAASEPHPSPSSQHD